MFNKLQTRLLGAFVLVVLFVFSITIFISLTQNKLLNQYDSVIKTQLQIYKIDKLTNDLSNNYSNRIRETTDQDLINEYTSINLEITNVFSELANKISSDESRVAFIGLKNLVTSVQDDCSKGIIAAKEGDLVTAFSIYDTISRKKYYVEENTSKLIFIELDQTEHIREQIVQNTQQNYTLVISLSLMTLILCTIFSIFFTRTITNPINSLINLTKEIDHGNFDFKIPYELLNKKDEIGSFANSFQQMKITIKTHLDNLLSANDELKKAQQDVEQKNIQLQKVNKIMIGRELRMIDLKKSTANLKQRVEDLEKKN